MQKIWFLIFFSVILIYNFLCYEFKKNVFDFVRCRGFV